ncbi:MAG: restriction endonuclease subunit R [Citromicrobium sp.]|nr:restriction endonuclease subunit R [Citromicrobium sp.]|tara:strand:- start:11971 stop:14862 length:2892 start_codon:yes stop_codon:yes gene_type:complete
MKLKFDPSLQYQQDAISAVVDVFDGQPIAQSSFEISQTTGGLGLVQTELAVGNAVQLADDKILENVRAVQERNDIEMVPELQGMEFSIEMETGTGKTYVYLRSIFELNKKYGFKKFIIVVPSIAIREGVLKSIEIMGEHFRTLYDNVPFKSFVYDSKKLENVNAFAKDNSLQIMIINIQSFQREANIFNQEHERSYGYRPRDLVKAARPILIIDEPQNMEGERSAEAIRDLEAVATLRYSATHKNFYNLLYKLDPVRAYDLRLVKQIEVASIRSDDSFNDAYVKLLQTDNKNGIKAQVEIHKMKPSGEVGTSKLWVKQGDDLFVKSGEIELYRDGYLVQNIDCTPDAEYIEFNQGKFLELGQEMGGMGDDIMKAQVFEAVEQHLKKERALKGKGIKVLSLFFIDKVANYRIYNDDGSTSHGKIAQWFEEAYTELTAKPLYKSLINHPVEKVHDGYFSQDRQGRAKDTSGTTKDDEDTYSLIMREKERLLDPDEPLRFIFSHSALREGWDNPNVFQICTLNETKSQDKKRQEIGRGLRLPVNKKGERVHDEHINRLTIIANESYEDFARSLQTEFEEDCGITFGRVDTIAFSKLVRPTDDTVLGQATSKSIWEALVGEGYLTDKGEITDKFDPKNPLFELKMPDEFAELRPVIIDTIQLRLFKNRVINAREKKAVKFNKHVQLSPEFSELWSRIKHRTRYRVKYETSELINKAVKRIKELEEIKPVRLSMTRVGVDITEAGVQADRTLEQRTRDAEAVKVLPDILAYLQKETELTRHTLVEILKQSGRLDEFKINPQAFMTSVGREIGRALHDLMLEGIQYEKLAHEEWEMSRIEPDSETEITRYLNNLYLVQNQSKSLFDHIEFDSEVEKQFAKDLDNNEHVKLFVKLPRWFKIDTPIGPYNPDWAFVTEREEKLYFVRETKSTLDSEERRTKENQKIKCGERHFEALEVDFGVVTKLSEVVI